MTDACPFYIRVCYFENLTNNFITNEVSKKPQKVGANESLDVPGPMLKKYFRQRIPKPLPTQNIGAQFDMRYAAGHLSTKLRGTQPFKGVEEKKMGRSTRTNNATLLLAKICSM